MHSTAPGELPPASAVKVDYQSVSVVGSAGSFPLVKAHGNIPYLILVYTITS